MQITTISATYERKHNLGDYNSANIGMTLWAQLEDGEDEAAAATALRDMARNHVMTELSRIDKRIEAKVQDLFMGLPVEVRKKLVDAPNPPEPITWDELAQLYDANNSGRRAKTLEMDNVFKWAERQSDLFIVSEDGSLYHKED